MWTGKDRRAIVVSRSGKWEVESKCRLEVGIEEEVVKGASVGSW